MYDLIKNEEIEMIEYSRQTYGYENKDYNGAISTKKFLIDWENSKTDLFKLLGNNLIYETPLKLEATQESIYKKLTSIRSEEMPEFWRKAQDYLTINNKRGLSYLLSDDTLSKRIYDKEDITLSDKHKIRKGMKIMKVLKILNEEFCFATDEEYEKFRIWHSMIFNSAVMEGTLCLSIHPLDYITMSDNDENWSSCMSWAKNGCYRRGTIEMMNSPYIIVAYLTNHDHKMKIDGNEWNSKKYRILIYVDQDIIVNIKAYPYQHKELNQKIVGIVRELAIKNLGWEYEDNLKCTEDNDFELANFEEDAYGCTFETNAMYNDFAAGVIHYYYDGIGHKLSYNRYNYKNYSGLATCVYCGEEVYNDYNDEARDLICDSCAEYEVCSCCGYRIRYNDDIYYVEGDPVCYSCWEDSIYCPIVDDYYFEDNIEKIYLAINTKEGVKISDFIMYIPTASCDEYLEEYFGHSEVDGAQRCHWYSQNYMLLENLLPGKDINDFFDERITEYAWFQDFFFVKEI